jgi:hypothetical protein
LAGLISFVEMLQVKNLDNLNEKSLLYKENHEYHDEI